MKRHTVTGWSTHKNDGKSTRIAIHRSDGNTRFYTATKTSAARFHGFAVKLMKGIKETNE